MIGIEKGKECEYETDNTDCCDNCDDAHRCDSTNDCDVYIETNYCQRTPKGYIICVDHENKVYTFSYCLPHLIETRRGMRKSAWKEFGLEVWK